MSELLTLNAKLWEQQNICGCHVGEVEFIGFLGLWMWVSWIHNAILSLYICWKPKI